MKMRRADPRKDAAALLREKETGMRQDLRRTRRLACWALLAVATVPAFLSAGGGGARVAEASGPRASGEKAGLAAAGRDPHPALDVLSGPPVASWRTFTTRDGLPSNKAFAVKVDGRRVWVGTDNGLARYEDGAWQVYGTRDGLPSPVVLALDVSPRTGDVWVATMGGLARWSGGRIDAFSQLDSGLSNDFVHSVRADPEGDFVWAATAMGVSRLDLRRGEWTVFTEQNTPMREPWTYSVAFAPGLVYVGAWGAGVLEYTPASEHWREYHDPDGEMEIDLFPDDGPVHDVTAALDFAGGILWQATYFGLARYDGRRWRSYFKEDSGLASNFINFVRAQERAAWLCTDDGLSVTDGRRWITYRRLDDGRGEILFQQGGRRLGRRITASAPAHNFTLGVDFQDDAIWVATAEGVSRGVADRAAVPAVRWEAPVPPETRAVARAADTGFIYARTPPDLRPFHELTPYKEFFTTRPVFRGPGREAPDPAGLEEVRIGFIGSLEERDGPILPAGFRPVVQSYDKTRFGRHMLWGARLALEEANAAGGYRGKPFRLVARTDLVQWGQTSNELVKFAYDDKVWAVLSGIDSNHNHVLSRATLKIQVPILNAGATDPTLVEHAIPWLARTVSDDRQNAYVLLDYIYRVQGLRRVALLRVNDRDGRVGVQELVQGARRLGHPVVTEQRFSNGDTDFADALRRVREAEPDAVVVWGNPREAGLAVRQLRDLGMQHPLFGFDRMAVAQFLEVAGPAAEGVVVVTSFKPAEDGPAWQRFSGRYRERFGEEPDVFAAHAYDGANILVRAIRAAGLNRARVRDALYALESVRGVSGEIVFDTNMSNVTPPWLAEVRGGRLRYFRAATGGALAGAARGVEAAPHRSP